MPLPDLPNAEVTLCQGPLQLIRRDSAFLEERKGVADDLDVLVRVAMARAPRLVFEIGTGHGSAVANIAKYTQARFVTTNPKPDAVKGHHVTFEHLPAGDIGRLYRLYGYSPRVRQVYMNSEQFSPEEYAPLGSCDLAIIDGCHDAAVVRADFHKMVPMMSPGGLIMFHDCHASKGPHTRGIHLVCLSLRDHKFDIRAIPRSWWAVWEAN